MNKYILVLLCGLALSGCGKKNEKKRAAVYHQKSVEHVAWAIQQPEQERAFFCKALDAINHALDLDHAPEYFALKGTILFKMGEFVQSERSFIEALKIIPSGPLRCDVLNNYACLLAQMGRDEQALGIWRMLTLDEFYITPEIALVNQGRVLALKNDYQKAKEAFLKAISLAPDYVDAHYYLMSLAQQQGELNIAKQAALSALSLAPEHQGVCLAAAQLGVVVNQDRINDLQSDGESLLS